MQKRISDAEIHYLFGGTQAAEVEAVFAALVTVEDAIRKRNEPMKERLSVLLSQAQPVTVEKFIRRLLQVEPGEAGRALNVAINFVFAATSHYLSALHNYKAKARSKPSAVADLAPDSPS